MFGAEELERLRLQKERLILQGEAHRQLLAADWQRLRSPETWLSEAGGLVRRHPVWTTALATAAGALVVQTLRKPGQVMGGLGRLGQLASTAFTVWKLFRKG